MAHVDAMMIACSRQEVHDGLESHVRHRLHDLVLSIARDVMAMMHGNERMNMPEFRRLLLDLL